MSELVAVVTVVIALIVAIAYGGFLVGWAYGVDHERRRLRR